MSLDALGRIAFSRGFITVPSGLLDAIEYTQGLS